MNGAVVEKYLWADLITLLAIYDSSDNLVQRFEYADGRMPLSMTSNGTKYYLHYDQVGSLRAVSDSSGDIIKEVVYDTFGTILSDSNEAFKVPFGFAGGLYDQDTKLTRFGYRDYDAETGKWTAKDPIGFEGGDSNLYGYVLGDPVNFVDPTGEYLQYIIPLVELIGGAGTVYAIVDSVDNLFNDENKRAARDSKCAKIQDIADRQMCYNKSRDTELKSQINNACETGKNLTGDIKTLRYQ